MASSKGGAKRRRLGKGLDALLATQGLSEADAAGGAKPADDADRVLHLDPHAIKPNPKQPRHEFVEEALEELAESIRRNGVQEPIIVRKVGGGYELVSGERRVRASIMADQETVPAVCRAVSDADMLRLGLIENIHREDLNPIELAEAYQALIAEFGWTQEELSAEVGKSRATVANTLRLLQLPGEVQHNVAQGALSMGHAKALLAFDSPAQRSNAAKKIIAQGLSVRQAEKLAAPKKPAPAKAPGKDPNLAHIEDELRRTFGTKVVVRATKPKAGRIEIEYTGLDQLDRILAMLRKCK